MASELDAITKRFQVQNNPFTPDSIKRKMAGGPVYDKPEDNVLDTRNWLQKTGDSVLQRTLGTPDLVMGFGNLAIGDRQGAEKRLMDWQANEELARAKGPEAQDIADIEDVGSAASVFGYQVAKMVPDLIMGGVAGGLAKGTVKSVAADAIKGRLARKILESKASQIAEKKAADAAVRDLRKTAVYKELGNRAAERAAKKDVREAASDQYVKEVTEGATVFAKQSPLVKNVGNVGFAAGATAGSLPGQLQEQGQFALDNVDKLSQEDTMKLLAGSTVAASTDFLPMMAFMNRFSKTGVKQAMAADGFAKRMLKASAGGFGAEGGQEAAQAFITRGSQHWVDENVDMFSDEALQDYAMNFVAGGFIGGGLGASGEIGSTVTKKAADAFINGIQKFDAQRAQRQKIDPNKPTDSAANAAAAAVASGRTLNPMAAQAADSSASGNVDFRQMMANSTALFEDTEKAIAEYQNGGPPLFNIDNSMRNVSKDPFVQILAGTVLSGISPTVKNSAGITVVNPELKQYMPGVQALAKAWRNGMLTEKEGGFLTDADMEAITDLLEMAPDQTVVNRLVGIAATRPNISRQAAAAIDARLETARQEAANRSGEMDITLRDDGSANIVLPDVNADGQQALLESSDAEGDFVAGRTFTTANKLQNENTPQQRAEGVAAVFRAKNPPSPERVFLSEDMQEAVAAAVQNSKNPKTAQTALGKFTALAEAYATASPENKAAAEAALSAVAKSKPLRDLYKQVKAEATGVADAAAAENLTGVAGMMFGRNPKSPGPYEARVAGNTDSLYVPNKSNTAALDLGMLYRRAMQLSGTQEEQSAQRQMSAALAAVLAMPGLNLDTTKIPWGKTIKFKDGKTVRVPFKKDVKAAQNRDDFQDILDELSSGFEPTMANNDPLDLPDVEAGDDQFGVAMSGVTGDLMLPGGVIAREQPMGASAIVEDAPDVKANLNVSKKALQLRSKIRTDAAFAVYGNEFNALGFPEADSIERAGAKINFYKRDANGKNTLLGTMTEGEFAEKAPTIFTGMQGKIVNDKRVSALPPQYGTAYGWFLMPDKIHTQTDARVMAAELLTKELMAKRPQMDDRTLAIEINKIASLPVEALDAAFERALNGDFDPRMRISEKGNATFKNDYSEVEVDEDAIEVDDNGDPLPMETSSISRMPRKKANKKPDTRRMNRDDFIGIVWNALTVQPDSNPARRVQNVDLATEPMRVATVPASQNLQAAGTGPGGQILKKTERPYIPEMEGEPTSMAIAMSGAAYKRALAKMQEIREAAAAQAKLDLKKKTAKVEPGYVPGPVTSITSKTDGAVTMPVQGDTKVLLTPGVTSETQPVKKRKTTLKAKEIAAMDAKVKAATTPVNGNKPNKLLERPQYPTPQVRKEFYAANPNARNATGKEMWAWVDAGKKSAEPTTKPASKPAAKKEAAPAAKPTTKPANPDAKPGNQPAPVKLREPTKGEIAAYYRAHPKVKDADPAAVVAWIDGPSAVAPLDPKKYSVDPNPQQRPFNPPMELRKAYIAANPGKPITPAAIWAWHDANTPKNDSSVGSLDIPRIPGTPAQQKTAVRNLLVRTFGEKTVRALESTGFVSFKTAEEARASDYPSLNNTVQGYAYNGRVTFIVDRVPNDRSKISAIMVHEAVHAWLPNMLGVQEFTRLANMHLKKAIELMGNNPGTSALSANEIANHPVWQLYGLQRMRGAMYTKNDDGSFTINEDKDQRADEALAYQVQYDAAKFDEFPWFKKIITRVANAIKMMLWKHRMKAPAEFRGALDAMYNDPQFLQHLAAQSIHEAARQAARGNKSAADVANAAFVTGETLARYTAHDINAALADEALVASGGKGGMNDAAAVNNQKTGSTSAGTAPTVPGGSTGSAAAAKLAEEAQKPGSKTKYPLTMWQRDDFTAFVNKRLTPEQRNALYNLAHGTFANVWKDSKSPSMQKAWSLMNSTGRERMDATLYYLLQAHSKGELQLDAQSQKALDYITLGKRHVGAITDVDLGMKILSDMKDGSLLDSVRKQMPYQPERQLMQVNTKLAKAGRWIAAATERARKLFANFITNDYDRAESSGIPSYIELVDLIMPRAGNRMQVDPKTGTANHGVVPALAHENARWLNRLSEAAKGLDQDGQAKVLRELYYNLPDPRAKAKLSPAEVKAFHAIRKVYADMYDYAAKDGVFNGKNRRANYTPVLFDIGGNVEQHKAVLKRLFDQRGGKGLTDYKYEAMLDDIYVKLNPADKGKTQVHFTSLNARERESFVSRLVENAFFDPSDLLLDNQMGTRFKFDGPRVFQAVFDEAKASKDFTDLDALVGTLDPSLEQHGVRYVEPLVAKTVENRLLPEKKFVKLYEAMRTEGATQEDLDAAERLYHSTFNRYKFPVMGPDGQVGSPTIGMFNKSLAMKMHNRSTLRTMQNLGAWQNLRLLPLALLSSLVDPGGLVIRSGGRLTDSLTAMKDGIKGLMDKDTQAALFAAAEAIGYSAELNAAMTLQDGFGAGARTPFARSVNSWIFKVNQMEAWTRQTRLMAVQAANSYLVFHQQQYRDPNSSAKDKAYSKAVFEKLGLLPDDVRVGFHGAGPLQGRPMVLVYSPEQAKNASKAQLEADARVKAAMVQWVDEAILRPNVAQTPTWHKDPFVKLITQYKAFSYSIYEQLTRHAVTELRDGNYAVLNAALIYLPVALMAELLREFLQHGPDGNPQRAQWTGTDYAGHAVVKTGLLGPTFDFQHGLFNDAERGGVIGRSFAGPTVGSALDVGAAVTGQKSVGNVVESQMPLSALWKHWNNDGGVGSKDPIASAVPTN